MDKLLSYQRDFSDLAGLQEGKTLFYVLTEETVRGTKLYGTQVTEIGKYSTEHDMIRPFTDDKSLAELLLAYLYENAVRVPHCRAIINDVCTAFSGIEAGDSCSCRR